mmetsp:Transcript_59214/g.105213  ORF Transcript_59214/g.105213 Transcript_59214/m.105213 type:complete len:351 (+) Transcript_59214:116-1168(+)
MDLGAGQIAIMQSDHSFERIAPTARNSPLVGDLLVILFGLLNNALRANVGCDREDNNHDGQEGRYLELVFEHGKCNLRNVDHEHSTGLADVLQDRVQQCQDIHGAPALDGEGCKHACGDAIPAVEEAILPSDTISEGDREDGGEPSALELNELHVNRCALEILHVLVGQHGAEARHSDLKKHVDHAHDRNCTIAAVARAANHVNTHGEHDQDEDVPLKCSLLGALDSPHHQRSDDKLGLKEDLVGCTSQRAHAGHLQIVAESIHKANHREYLHWCWAPDLPPFVHASTGKADELCQDEGHHCLSNNNCHLSVCEVLLARLRVHTLGCIDDGWMHCSGAHEEGEESELGDG